LAAAATRFWVMSGYPAQGRRRLESALTSDDQQTPARARALNAAALLAFEVGDVAAAIHRADEALAATGAAGDAWGSAYARFLLGQGAIAEQEFAVAHGLFEESLRTFQGLGDEHYAMVARFNLAWMSGELGDVDRGKELHEENLRRAREAGNQRIEALSLSVLADSEARRGNTGQALSMLHEAYRIVCDVGDRVESVDIVSRFAGVLASAARPATAARLLSCNETQRQLFGGTRATRLATDRLEALAMGGFPPREGPYGSMLAVTRAAHAMSAKAAGEPAGPAAWIRKSGDRPPGRRRRTGRPAAGR